MPPNFPFSVCYTTPAGVIMWFETGLIWVTDYLENGINFHGNYDPEEFSTTQIAQKFADLNDWGEPKLI